MNETNRKTKNRVELREEVKWLASPNLQIGYKKLYGDQNLFNSMYSHIPKDVKCMMIQNGRTFEGRKWLCLAPLPIASKLQDESAQITPSPPLPTLANYYLAVAAYWPTSLQVIPVQHASALDGVPRIAAVFQNDCLYLAHHMITLGHEFRHSLPPPANQTATMIDTVPLFREMAAQR